MQPMLPHAVQAMRRLFLPPALANHASMLQSRARSTFVNVDLVSAGTKRAAHPTRAATIAVSRRGAADVGYDATADINDGDQVAVRRWIEATAGHGSIHEVH